MPNYKKRSTYQTGGATKPMQPKQISQAQMNAMIEAENRQRAAAQRQAQAMRQREQQLAAMPPASMQSMPLATGQRMSTGARTATSQEAERKRQEMIRRDKAMMEVGNRQRLAAMEAAKKRAYNQATTRTQDLRNTPRKLSPAQQRLLDSYNRGMAQQRQQRNAAATRPATPRLTPQQIAAATQRQRTPQKTLQARPVTPRPTNSARNMGERRRLQQQIAQLQARLRQLGG